jgi:hypothetical protein
MPSPARDRLLNFALYQAGWLACVLGAAHGLGEAGALVALALLAVHVALSRDRPGELALAAAAGLLGLVVDSLIAASGRLNFADAPVAFLAPPWVLALWMQLGTTLRGCLAWLAASPVRAALFGLIGGPLAFLGGERLGAATWAEPRWATVLTLAVAWGAATPLLFALAARLGRGRPTGYR